MYCNWASWTWRQNIMLEKEVSKYGETIQDTLEDRRRHECHLHSLLEQQVFGHTRFSLLESERATSLTVVQYLRWNFKSIPTMLSNLSLFRAWHTLINLKHNICTTIRSILRKKNCFKYSVLSKRYCKEDWGEEKQKKNEKVLTETSFWIWNSKPCSLSFSLSRSLDKWNTMWPTRVSWNLLKSSILLSTSFMFSFVQYEREEYKE